MALIDNLFDARNLLVVGNYKQAILEANTARPPASRKEAEEFYADKFLIVAQSHIGLQQEAMAKDVSSLNNKVSADHPVVQAVLLWADFLICGKKAGGFNVEDEGVAAALSNLQQASQDLELRHVVCGIFTVQALLATRNYEAALTTAMQWICQLTDTADGKVRRCRMELHYFVVEALLRIHRFDHAERELKTMMDVDDESVFAILAQSLVALHQGQEGEEGKRKEYIRRTVSYINSAFVRYGQTPMLLHWMAIAHASAGSLDEAERMLIDAGEMASSSATDDLTPFNTCGIQALKGRGDAASGTQEAIEGTPGWMAEYAEVSQRLDDALRNFSS